MQCMHESCEDFDLCDNCEALPIPVHPINHPLLKMKTPSVIVPTILKAEEIAVRTLQSRPVSPYNFEYASECVVPHVETSPSIIAIPELEPLINAPAQPPALPLPEFTPELQVPTLIPVRTPTPETANPVYYTRSLNPFLWDSQVLSSPIPVVAPEPATPVVIPPSVNTRTPSPFDTPFVEEEIVVPTQAPPLVDIDEGEGTPIVQKPESTAGGISTPSEVPESSASSHSVPKLGPVNELGQLWPELFNTFKHLLQPPTADAASASTTAGHDLNVRRIFGEVEPAGAVKDVTQGNGEIWAIPTQESPLTGEPLLCRPLMPEVEKPASLPVRSLSDLLSSVRPEAPALPSSSPPPVSQSPAASPVPLWRNVARPSPPTLTAEFVSDNNIPDGQIFPPGAEFVKSWRMRNDGTVDWPESTQLVFVAGDRMAPHPAALSKVHVGLVKAGEEVELVSGEMKVRPALRQSSAGC